MAWWLLGLFSGILYPAIRRLGFNFIPLKKEDRIHNQSRTICSMRVCCSLFCDLDKPRKLISFDRPPVPIQNKRSKKEKGIEKLLRVVSGILVRIGYSKEQRKVRTDYASWSELPI